MSTERPRIGVSRCLLGEPVRYDGGHKGDRFLLDSLDSHVEWVPVCPELEVGMGVPREAVHLIVAADGVPAGSERVRLVGVRSREDWTERLAGWAGQRVSSLVARDLSGFIFKKDSPSCGVHRVRVHDRGSVARTGRGLFAEAVLRANPFLPVEEEGRLQDAHLRENFVERVFAFTRLKLMFAGRWTVGALVAFHTVHKLQLLSHSRVRYAELGRLVADAKKIGRTELANGYRAAFMQALAVPATRGRNADVMLHMLGHLKRQLDRGDRDELIQLVDEYRSGIVPLVVPLTLFRHHSRAHEVEYLNGQTYLEPHPRELALRNHA